MKLRYYVILHITISFLSSQFAFSQTASQGEKPVLKSAKNNYGDVIPAVRSFSPVSGHVGETLSIIFTGVNIFEGVTNVNFGPGVIVNAVKSVDPTHVAVAITIPDTAAVGIRSIVLKNNIPGGGSITLSNVFTIGYPVPVLQSIEPSIVERGTSASVVLKGNNFLQGATAVNFGSDIIVNSIKRLSATELQVDVTVPAEIQTGARTATVANSLPGGGSATLKDAFVVHNPKPALASVSPGILNKGETGDIIVSGANFIAGVSSINLGTGITLNSTTVSNSSQIILNITVAPSAQTGARNVIVTNTAPGGGSVTLPDAFTVGNPRPTLSTASMATGQRGQNLSVSLTGINFAGGVTSVSFGPNISVNSLAINSATQATALISITPSAETGARDVVITNAAPGGGTASLAGVFTVTNPAPSVKSIASSSASKGGVATVTISGANFFSGVTSVNFGADVTVSSLTVKSVNEMIVSLSVSSVALPGVRTVAVTNAAPGGGTTILPGGFTVTQSTLIGLEGAMGPVPEEYTLQEAYPNPFNPSTKIRYGVPERSRVRLEIYNMLGNVVADLVSGERTRGYYEIVWMAEGLPTGVYLVRLQSESLESNKTFLGSRKVVLVK
ncbi:MAG: T9SS type A sorting domain-containing protein [Ignavibacteriales bacterium]|nr:T9SS type A sorting domain-containing protein [Ignavibacteriales bacterium]